jgi:hypothetical protein
MKKGNLPLSTIAAFRLPAADVSTVGLNAKISSSAGNFGLEQLIDGDVATTNLLRWGFGRRECLDTI